MAKTAQKSAASRVNQTKRDRTLPIPSSVQKVPGFGTLTIYKMEASPFWYARYYEDGKIIRRSLKVADKKEALKAAKKVFVDIKHHQMNKLPYTSKSGFEVCARGLLKENAAKVARGELSPQKLQYDTARLEADLLPHFGKYEMADISYGVISDYINRLSTPQFDQLLKVAELKTTANGENRALYSLRHTCIMFRLTKGDNVALLTLARSARTSPEMIDRFYAKHLTAEMNVEQLQSFKQKQRAGQSKGVSAGRRSSPKKQK